MEEEGDSRWVDRPRWSEMSEGADSASSRLEDQVSHRRRRGGTYNCPGSKRVPPVHRLMGLYLEFLQPVLTLVS